MALIEAVRGRYDIPQRWYPLKASCSASTGSPTMTGPRRCFPRT